MHTELPVCKRCCFCVPLRYGLLTWGYLKLIATTVVMVALVISLVYTAKMTIRRASRYEDIVIMSIVLLMLLTEIVLAILFVVGGHMKNVKLLRIYYIYNLVLWGLSIALFLVFVCLSLPTLVPDRYSSYHAYVVVIDISSYFVNIVMQSYFLLLLRSEIIKLRNNCQFQFSNNAADAACTMNYSEQLLDEEMGTEDDCGKRTCGTGVCQKTCQTNGTFHKNEDLS